MSILVQRRNEVSKGLQARGTKCCFSRMNHAVLMDSDTLANVQSSVDSHITKLREYRRIETIDIFSVVAMLSGKYEDYKSDPRESWTQTPKILIHVQLRQSGSNEWVRTDFG